MPQTLTHRADITLQTAWSVGFESHAIDLSDQARARISHGRGAFERLLASDTPPYIYGSTTAPGARAKTKLSDADQAKLVELQNIWACREIGMGSKYIPEHATRLILLARVASYIEGNTAISLPTAEWVADLSRKPMGNIPLEAATGPGEVMPLSCLYPSDPWGITLQAGDIMALYNGSPCATGLALDAALIARRRPSLLQQIMALVIEAAGAPLDAYDPAIAEVSTDPHMKTAIIQLNNHLQGVPRTGRLPHQAPVSWRIIPTILAAQIQAVTLAEETALHAIHSVAQNPLFVPPTPDHPDGRVLSNGGYHNQQASRAIDGLNAAGADICVLMGKQTARLMDGAPFGLPRLLVDPNSGVVGSEFIAWSQSGIVERARLAATPATLPTGLEDPGGGQSDVASPIFLAFERHLDICDAVTASMSSLSIAMVQTYRLSGRTPPDTLKPLHDAISAQVIPFSTDRFVELGTSMRRLKDLFSDALVGQGQISPLIRATCSDNSGPP
ncbi:MAG: aromatic amino acid lyase [Pseudomonadota bacterium]